MISGARSFLGAGVPLVSGARSFPGGGSIPTPQARVGVYPVHLARRGRIPVSAPRTEKQVLLRRGQYRRRDFLVKSMNAD